MSKVFVSTDIGNSVMQAGRMVKSGDLLTVYDGEELVGMFRSEAVKMAYKSEPKPGCGMAGVQET